MSMPLPPSQDSPDSTSVPPSTPEAPPQRGGGAHAAVATYPLEPIDPPKIGDFWPSARLVSTPSGVAYLAYEDHATAPVMVILLSKGAAGDPAARDRLAGQVDRMDIDTVIARGGVGQNTGRLADKFRSEADDPQADPGVQSPWVALAFDQTTSAVDEARRILAEVDLSWLTDEGTPAGPNYRLHWTDQVSPGLTRVWPLPWPGRRERGGRLSILASWLLMLLLAAIAVLIAILIFSRAPQTSPPPPIPPTQTSTEHSSFSPPPTASPWSGTPSGSSGSPSPSWSRSGDTGSPSPSTASASPTDQGGSPTPISRL